MPETRAQKREREERMAAAAAVAPAPAPTPAPHIPVPPVPAISASGKRANRKRKRNKGNHNAVPEDGEAEPEQQAAGVPNVAGQVVEVPDRENPRRKRKRPERDDGNSANADRVSPSLGRPEDEAHQNEQEPLEQGERFPGVVEGQEPHLDEAQENEAARSAEVEHGPGFLFEGAPSTWPGWELNMHYQVLKRRRPPGRNLANGVVHILCSDPGQPMRPLNLPQLLGSGLATIQEEILRNLGPFEISALSRTSSGFRDMRSTLRNTNYNINARLGHFFNDTVAFRMFLARWQGIITGGFVGELFNRSGPVPTNLDLALLDKGQMRARAHAFLVGEGYTQREDNFEEDLGDFELHWEIVYSKHHAKYGELRINIRASELTPVLTHLQFATTTLDCMFITHEKAYMLYPHATYKRKETYILLPEPYLEGKRDYTMHGYKFISTSLVESVEAALALPRRIGDGKTWKLSLDMQGFEGIPEYSPFTNVEHMTFRLSVSSRAIYRGNDVRHYEMAVRSVSQGVLKYAVMDMNWDQDDVEDYLTRRLNDRVDVHPIRRYLERSDQLQKKLQNYTMMALDKLGQAETPEEYRLRRVILEEPVAREFFGSQANIPTHWPTYDEEVREALDEAWKEMQDSLETRKKGAIARDGIGLFPEVLSEV
ncbi:hypothetical protein SLS60_009219 [Paraconiothyrium brasiliense]|uniref:F-box domain-containing protein n=1 Tax=Paraconiothyrium brasiliense TaxID=300254 RepID=A0ABR3QWN2_9PLEO